MIMSDAGRRSVAASRQARAPRYHERTGRRRDGSKPMSRSSWFPRYESHSPERQRHPAVTAAGADPKPGSPQFAEDGCAREYTEHMSFFTAPVAHAHLPERENVTCHSVVCPFLAHAGEHSPAAASAPRLVFHDGTDHEHVENQDSARAKGCVRPMKQVAQRRRTSTRTCRIAEHFAESRHRIASRQAGVVDRSHLDGRLRSHARGVFHEIPGLIDPMGRVAVVSECSQPAAVAAPKVDNVASGDARLPQFPQYAWANPLREVREAVMLDVGEIAVVHRPLFCLPGVSRSAAAAWMRSCRRAQIPSVFVLDVPVVICCGNRLQGAPTVGSSAGQTARAELRDWTR